MNRRDVLKTLAALPLAGVPVAAATGSLGIGHGIDTNMVPFDAVEMNVKATDTPGIGYVRNCYIKARDNEPDWLFSCEPEGVFCQLDGYAIVPREEFDERAHYYDFACEPMFTDDPRFPTLTRGAHNVLLLDGKRVEKVTRCRTGRDGWVQRFVMDSNGLFIVEAWNNWTGEWADQSSSGAISYNRCRPDGVWEWGESRVKREIVHGHVEFCVIGAEC